MSVQQSVSIRPYVINIGTFSRNEDGTVSFGNWSFDTRLYSQIESLTLNDFLEELEIIYLESQ